ncbi:MAG: hypothetical protein JNJ88_04740 [Planctomycetes bacterium]|nr:hypothetical protein [Planctomycetota bacterium]
MLRPATAVAFLLGSLGFASLQGQRKDEIRERFLALDAKRDHAGIVELWKDAPARALPTIDEDLEGFLALVEKGGDSKEIEKMKERALRGAKAADQAFQHPIFSDYTSSYVGWNAEQQKQFRAGQQASGAAMQALQKKDFAAAKKEAQRSIDLARPLGDWWGASSGYGALGAAEEGLGNKEAALDAYQQARVLHHDLNFFDQEIRDETAMARLLLDLGRTVRAGVVLQQATQRAESRKNEKALAAIAELRKRLPESGAGNK